MHKLASGDGYRALDPCVHCGFCLPACPTYLATGDEADSPRGRILLMRALERGELPPDDAGLIEHLDACLGCRGCEPVCPSGVGYGRGLEAAQEALFQTRSLPLIGRAMLALFRRPGLWRPVFTAARMLRATGLPALLAGRGRNQGTLGFAMGMLAVTKGRGAASSLRTRGPAPRSTGTATVLLFRGCVMDTLFPHVHAATRRTLAANGYVVWEVADQGCCGALHAHAGDRAGARALARRNVAALADAADFIVVDSAGCGALLKDYGHLLGDEAAKRFAAKVRDVTELLAAAGPRPGAPLPLRVAYDAPCHLQHAQGVHAAPLAVLRAVPKLDVQLLPGSDRCCGSAGLYGLLRPELARRVLAEKIQTFADANPALDLVVTGNPGCLMHIGAGLRAAGLSTGVAHPVEVLDWAYQRQAAAPRGRGAVRE